MYVCIVRDATLPPFVDYIRSVIGRATSPLEALDRDWPSHDADVETFVTSLLLLLLVHTIAHSALMTKRRRYDARARLFPPARIIFRSGRQPGWRQSTSEYPRYRCPTTTTTRLTKLSENVPSAERALPRPPSRAPSERYRGRWASTGLTYYIARKPCRLDANAPTGLCHEAKK